MPLVPTCRRALIRFFAMSLLLLAYAVPSMASQCWVFRKAPEIGTWPNFSTGQEFCEYARSWRATSSQPAPNYIRQVLIDSCNYSGPPVSGTDPFYGIAVRTYYLTNGCDVNGTNCVSNYVSSIKNEYAGVRQVGCNQFYVTARTTPVAQCGSTPNCVGDPINPANGNTYKIEEDFNASDLSFRHFYNSAAATTSTLGIAWRPSFSRSIKTIDREAKYEPYRSGDPDYSAIHSDPATACINGFPQIQSRVSSWASTTTSYVNGVCQLIKDGTVVGSLPVYSAMGTPLALPTPTGYDVVRDDGQVIRFPLQGGVITKPAGVTLRLQQTPTGFELRDAQDNLESYDPAGRLLSVTSRAGVAQSLSYDSNGRLSSIIDGFGHRLNLSYDTQGRLSTVTQQ